MIRTNDVLLTLKAIEFMAKGVDITTATYEDYRNKNATAEGVLTEDSVDDYLMNISAVSEMFSFGGGSVIRRHHLDYEMIESESVNIEVTPEIFYSTMKVLRDKDITQFFDVDRVLYDTDFKNQLDNIRNTFNRTAPLSIPMMQALSKEATRKNFLTFVSVAYHDCLEVKQKLIEAYDKQYTKFNLAGFEDYPVYDNRIYIPLSEADKYDMTKEFRPDAIDETMDYIVISKNLYDYFYCSYGSEFQSCFSLTSEHAGWYGMIPLGIVEGHYIVYGTKKDAIKVSIDSSGNKWAAPYMFWRAWGWTENKTKQLMLDKCYTDRRPLTNFSENLLKSLGVIVDGRAEITRSVAGCTKFKRIYSEYKLRFYPDSIRMSTWQFCRDGGTKSFSGEKAFSFKFKRSLKAVLNDVKQVSDSIATADSIDIVNGVLSAFKNCPMTGIKISSELEQHYYAKYLLSPVTSCCIFTWIDGKVALTAASNDSCTDIDRDNVFRVRSTEEQLSIDKDFTYLYGRKYVNLKPLKEFLKGFVNKSAYQVILLRVVEDDKVTVVKYKQDGVK